MINDFEIELLNSIRKEVGGNIVVTDIEACGHEPPIPSLIIDKLGHHFNLEIRCANYLEKSDKVVKDGIYRLWIWRDKKLSKWIPLSDPKVFEKAIEFLSYTYYAV